MDQVETINDNTAVDQNFNKFDDAPLDLNQLSNALNNNRKDGCVSLPENSVDSVSFYFDDSLERSDEDDDINNCLRLENGQQELRTSREKRSATPEKIIRRSVNDKVVRRLELLKTRFVSFFLIFSLFHD
jgi:hypothetical protein